ncbi:hypothetical protein EYR40_011008 [Pleurotus pulmonarius]|nr:hypothetical protein EYR40_011008 [Pleurotus pulmonarius]
MSDTITQGEELATFSNHDDEARDPSYGQPSKKQRGHVKGSHHSLPNSVKLELEKTAPGQYCTLTLDPIHKPCAVDIAHIVDAATGWPRLYTLQEAWHTKELPNVDSPLNLMYLRADWHRLFDRGQWAMLPTIKLLWKIFAASIVNQAAPRVQNPKSDMFRKFSRNSKNTNSVSPKYEYQLLWLADSDPDIYPSLTRRRDDATPYLDHAVSNNSIGPVSTSHPPADNTLIAENHDDLQTKLTACQEEVNYLRSENKTLRAQIDTLSAPAPHQLPESTGKREQTGNNHHSIETAEKRHTRLLEFSSHYDVFLPPYTDFPTFESHVHPFFVIVNTGDKLLQVGNPSRFGRGAEMLLEIYRTWFNLPATAEPPRPAEPKGGDDDDDDQSSHTSDTDIDSSSFASGSTGAGSRKSARLAQKLGTTYDNQKRATNDHPAPCDYDNVPMLDPCSSSADTPSLVLDSSVNALRDDEELEDIDTSVSKWLAKAATGPPDETDCPDDRILSEYREEPPQQAKPQQWQEWASCPPKIPHVLKSYHDTSRLTSYHWSLYHGSVNLMAPTGSHRIPWDPSVVDDPAVDREYDMYDLGGMLRDFQQAWYTKDFPDVDSPLNLMYLRVDWHRLFDRNQWAILPAAELLVDIITASARNKGDVWLGNGVDLFAKFSKDPNTPKGVSPRFQYRFIWLGRSDPKIYPSLSRRKYTSISNLDTSIVTQENRPLPPQTGGRPAQVAGCSQDHMEEHEDPTEDPRHSTSSTAEDGVTKLLEFSSHYDVFLPPYTDFPTFESHVHPFFVIVNSGDKLSKVANPSQFGPEAQILLDIYRLWFKLPLPAAPEPPAASDGGGGDGNDESSCTSQTEGGGSSFESGSRVTGSNPVDAPQQSGGAYNTQNRATNDQPAPCGADDVPMLEPCSSSALFHDLSIDDLGFHINKDEELEDVDTLVSKWLAKVGAEPLDERDHLGDRELDEYRKEPPSEPQQWQEWASAPPKIPHILKSYHDTSRLTSYHWSLYHESVNLMAPTGSHRIPRHLTMVDDPDVDREYDMYDLGAMILMNLPPHLDAMLVNDGSEHSSYGHTLPDSAKMGLEKTARRKRCTLTLDPEPHGVDIAHIVEATNWPRLHALQEAWRTKDLPNVDSPLNSMYLRVDWHRLFDQFQWAMLPTDKLLLKILNASGANQTRVRYKEAPKDLFRKFSKGSKSTNDLSLKYEYRLLWLADSDPDIYPSLTRRRDDATPYLDHAVSKNATGPESTSHPQAGGTLIAETHGRDGLQAELTACQEEAMHLWSENKALRAQIDTLSAPAQNQLLEDTDVPDEQTGNRHNSIATAENRSTRLLKFSSHYEVYLPPYADFPTFDSHVHPFFVIINTGDKLSQVNNPSQFGRGAEMLLEIYRLWLNLPSPAEPPSAAEPEGDDDGDDQSSRTSQTDTDSSSFVSGSTKIGSRQSFRLAQKLEKAYDKRTTGEPSATCDGDNSPMLDPCNSSAGIPPPVFDSSVFAWGFHSLDEDEELEDIDSSVSKWLASADAGPPDEMDCVGDHVLSEYREETPQQAELQQWQEWASCPPKIPHVLKSYHDTSRLTSYHWSLYHGSVNLMAPTGSHRIPWDPSVVNDPAVDREYDMYDLGTTSS